MFISSRTAGVRYNVMASGCKRGDRKLGERPRSWRALVLFLWHLHAQLGKADLRRLPLEHAVDVLEERVTDEPQVAVC